MSLVNNAMKIWQAGVDATDPAKLVERSIRVDGGTLAIDNFHIHLDQLNRIYVAGGGKAGAAMVAGLEQALDPLVDRVTVGGTVIVPESLVESTRWIDLIAGRSSHENLATVQAVNATRRLLGEVAELDADDLCIALISGGGSALLCAPRPPVTLNDKLLVTRHLSEAGASIEQLNRVRSALSSIKRGGLARSCGSNHLVGMVLSDVMSGGIEVVASGPTCNLPRESHDQLIAICDRFDGGDVLLPILEKAFTAVPGGEINPDIEPINLLIGDNATAVAGARQAASDYGFQVRTTSIDPATTTRDLARQLLELIVDQDASTGPACFILGGEPIHPLPPGHGKGGRNQQLITEFWRQLRIEFGENSSLQTDFCLFAAGTDGEDGPTDAAGGWIDSSSISKVSIAELQLHVETSDAYPLLARCDQLFSPGPTGTNVCDLIVLLRR